MKVQDKFSIAGKISLTFSLKAAFDFYEVSRLRSNSHYIMSRYNRERSKHFESESSFQFEVPHRFTHH